MRVLMDTEQIKQQLKRAGTLEPFHLMRLTPRPFHHWYLRKWKWGSRVNVKGVKLPQSTRKERARGDTDENYSSTENQGQNRGY